VQINLFSLFHDFVGEMIDILSILKIYGHCDYYNFKQNEKILADHQKELRGPPAEEHLFKRSYCQYLFVKQICSNKTYYLGHFAM
jgi:hypothetical protein